jgi:hypothetical protein
MHFFESYFWFSWPCSKFGKVVLALYFTEFTQSSVSQIHIWMLHTVAVAAYSSCYNLL